MLDEKKTVESISNVRSTNSEMSRDKENLTLIVISMLTFILFRRYYKTRLRFMKVYIKGGL